MTDPPATPPRPTPQAPTLGTAHPWLGHRWFTPSGCLVVDAAADVDPAVVFQHAAGRAHALFLDSALVDPPAEVHATDAEVTPRLGRHSFVAWDPIHSIEVQASGDWGADAARIAAALDGLRRLVAELACPTIPGLPPLQGGVAGFLAYECGLARLGIEPPADLAGPLVSLHLYDVVFAYDHAVGRGWFISQGVPARGASARRRRAEERLEAVLVAPPTARQPAAPFPPVGGGRHPLPGHPRVTSSHDRDDYLAMVRAGIECIRAGDVFQVNLAQRLQVRAASDPVEIHLRARALNAAPFAAYFDTGPMQLVSMSPERFLQVSRGVVRSHPIKGTRRITSHPEADLFAGDDLEASAKDRAENVMIVDLLRNDLARVCTPQSVRVEALCRLERYRYVQHLVSVVAGRLRPGLGAVDALEGAIPGGSISGAPKHRACELIGRLEGAARGPYCGSLGYVGLDGTADFNLLIRTLVVTSGMIAFSAGGGVTAASDPALEYAESLHKAEGMLRVLEAFGIAGGVVA